MDLQSRDRNEIGKQQIGPGGITKIDTTVSGGVGKSRRQNIPEEIIEEHILVKLPVKSLFRFKTVSKSWLNLIKSDNFIYKHHHSPSAEEGGSYIAMCWFSYDEYPYIRPFLDVYIYELRDDTFIALPTSNKNNKKSFQIHGRPPFIDLYLQSPNLIRLRLSCNCKGILCFDDNGIIMLVNPFLSQLKRLPGEFLTPDKLRTYLLGFGFDDNTVMDFKVVRMFPREKIGEVYSLRSNTWRKLDETSGIPLVKTGYDIPCTFYHGKLYWLVLTVSGGTGRGRLISWGILTFNLATELFQLMEYPRCFPKERGLYSGFTLSNQEEEEEEEESSLAFVYCSKDGLVDLWTMTKVNNEEGGDAISWTKLYSIQCSPHFFRPVCFSISKKHNTFIYETRQVETGYFHLIKYDVMNQSSSTISQPFLYGQSGSYTRFSSLQGLLGVCRPSLFSLNSM